MFYIKDNDKMVAVKRIIQKDATKYTCEVLPEEGCVKGWLSAENKRCWYISREVFDRQMFDVMDIE